MILSVNTAMLFAQTGNVKVIYGYLYVFPNELGTFENEPSNVIRQLNSQNASGYSCWRIPTNEELALIRANGYADPQATYITKDSSRSGRVMLVTTKEDVTRNARMVAEQKDAERQRALLSKVESQSGYIDLGLPSGTRWAAQNYDGGRKFTHEKADEEGILPSYSQWEELRKECTWTWNSDANGFIIIGRNGNAIFLEATNGVATNDWTPQFNREGVGYYWSSTWEDERNGKDMYWCFGFEERYIGRAKNSNSWFPSKMLEGYHVCVRYVR